MGRFKRPKNWRDEVIPVYEAEGEAIGKALMIDRSLEPEIWKVVGGTGIWPRWYIHAFGTLYIERHPKQWRNLKSNRSHARRRARDRSGKLKHTREQAERRLNAHPDSENPQL